MVNGLLVIGDSSFLSPFGFQVLSASVCTCTGGICGQNIFPENTENSDNEQCAVYTRYWILRHQLMLS